MWLNTDSRSSSLRDNQPESHNQTTRAEDTQSSVIESENPTDENDDSHLPEQHARRPLRRPFVNEDCICRSPTSCHLPSKSTALLGQDTPGRATTVKQWSDDVPEGRSKTIWKTELSLLIRNASPLIATCLLQYTLTGASVLAVGHLGRNELGAVSLAIMTSNITGYVIYEGLSNWSRHSLRPSPWFREISPCRTASAEDDVLLMARHDTDRGDLAKCYSNTAFNHSGGRMCSPCGIVFEDSASRGSWLRGVRGGKKVCPGPGPFCCQLLRLTILRALEWFNELALRLGMLVWNQIQKQH